jgi:hypothetical protein
MREPLRDQSGVECRTLLLPSALADHPIAVFNLAGINVVDLFAAVRLTNPSGLSWYCHFRANHLYGNEFRTASGVLERFDSVFSRESPHNQGQLTIGCHLDGCQINPLHVFRGAGTTAIHFHNKFCVHDFHKCLRCCQALKEVLAMHGPRSSPSIDPVFPNSHEADIQPFFSGHSNFDYGR